MAQRVEDTVFALRRFVANAAHQLLTPLTALRTNLELIGQRDGQDDRRAHIERAKAQMDRLESLCSGLLDLSRLEAVASEEERSPISLDVS